MIKKDYNNLIGDENYKELNQESELQLWIQDNLRIIIAIIVVILMAVGIYSYSKSIEETNKEEYPTVSEEPIQEKEETPCEEYQNEELRYTPARCLKYFFNGKVE